jgi:hypothetical protein
MLGAIYKPKSPGIGMGTMYSTNITNFFNTMGFFIGKISG